MVSQYVQQKNLDMVPPNSPMPEIDEKYSIEHDGTIESEMTQSMGTTSSRPFQVRSFTNSIHYLRPHNSLRMNSIKGKGTKNHSQTASSDSTFASKEFTMGLDTILDEDEIIMFHDDIELSELPVPKQITQPVSSPKKYRMREFSNPNLLEGTPIYENDADIFEIDEEKVHSSDDENLELEDHALSFGRMQNLRATMRESHIQDLKMELNELTLIEDDTVLTEIDEEIEEDVTLDKIKKNDIKQMTLKQQVELIEKTKEELEQEKKVMELKRKTSKRVGFGADIALEIVQESIAQEEEKRQQAQHDFYVQQLYSMKDKKEYSSSMHLELTQKQKQAPKRISAPSSSPSFSSTKKMWKNQDFVIKNVMNMKHYNSANPENDADDDAANRQSMHGQLSSSRNHLRSRSDNQMIINIANQITLHMRANQIKKAPLEQTQPEKPSMISIPLNSTHMKQHHSSDDTNIYGEHLQVFSSDDDAKQTTPATNTLDVFMNQSILSTFRSWLEPKSFHDFHQNATQRSSAISRQDSDGMLNVNSFLKMAGFTIHSPISPASMNADDQTIFDDPNDTNMVDLEYGLDDEEEKEIDIHYDINENIENLLENPVITSLEETANDLSPNSIPNVRSESTSKSDKSTAL